MIPAAASVAVLAGCTPAGATSAPPPPDPRGRVLRFFTRHQAAVVQDATARIGAQGGSVFVTSGAHNPTNTIMAVALRNMRYLARS